MKLLNMDFGYTGDYSLKRIFAMNQHWDNDAVFCMKEPRQTSAFVFAAGCNLEYTLTSGKVLNAERGKIVYIPQGAVYTTRFRDTAKNLTGTVLIEFAAELSDGEPFIFYPDVTVLHCNSEKISEYFSEMVDLFMLPIPAPALEKSLLFRMLALIGGEEKKTNLRLREFASIADGIMYMENNTNQEKSIEEIAEMCHVSPSCFRRLFRKYSGVSPVRYQINVKLTHAKRLLQTNTMSVSEISDALGFYDTAYFSKLFKKHVGVSPKEYAKSFSGFDGAS